MTERGLWGSEGAHCPAAGQRTGMASSPEGGGRAEWRTRVVLSGVGCCTLQFEEIEVRRLGFLLEMGTW